MYYNNLITPANFINGITHQHPLAKAVLNQAMEVFSNNRVNLEVSYNGKDFKVSFTSPSESVGDNMHMDYAGKQWLWDSCFHIISLAEKNPEFVKKEFLALLVAQREDGFIPHMHHWFKDGQTPPGWAIKKGQTKFWRDSLISDITQPPILAIALKAIYDSTKDLEYLKKTIPPIVKFYNYLHEKRDPDKDNLISILHPWESGWDNSQRWDVALNLPYNNGPVNRSYIDDKKKEIFLHNASLNWQEEAIFESGKFDVEPVDFNVIYALNMAILADLCSVINDNDNQNQLLKRSKDTTNAIFNIMWDGQKYTDIVGKNNIPSDIKSAAMFYPLILEGEIHYQSLIENFLIEESEFMAPFGIPTVSRSDKTYSPSDYWRGNIWPPVNYFICCGLANIYKKHNYKLAKALKNYIAVTYHLILHKEGFYEYFNPETGAGFGVKNLSWNGIASKILDL